MASIGHRSNKETWWPHKDLFHFREDLHQEEVQGIIKAFTANSKGPLRRIVVQRKNLWKSASAFWLLPTVQGRTGLLLCKFSGEVDNAEPSVDQGGPRREFFDLLKTSMIRESGLFSTGKLISYARSEEHTSELQSRETISYAVFCLKKKKNKKKKNKNTTIKSYSSMPTQTWDTKTH